MYDFTEDQKREMFARLGEGHKNVIAEFCKGAKSRREVAKRLGYSENTVKTYLTQIYSTLYIEGNDDEKKEILMRAYCRMVQEGYIPPIPPSTDAQISRSPSPPRQRINLVSLLLNIALIAAILILILWRRDQTSQETTPVAMQDTSIPIQATTLAPPPTQVLNTPIPAIAIPTDTYTPIPTDTLAPPPPTETYTLAPAVTRPTATLDPHAGEVNLLISNLPLPAKWITKGKLTYWEGYIHVQSEPFIDLIIEDCGDNDGNERLDILQLFSPQSERIININNCNGTFRERIITANNPGYYRIFLQDNDTSLDNGNGGTLKVEYLENQSVYLYPP